MYERLPVERLSGDGQACARRPKNGIDKSTEILRGVATIGKTQERIQLKPVGPDQAVRSRPIPIRGSGIREHSLYQGRRAAFPGIYQPAEQRDL